jgi:spermidine synthase
MVLAGVTGFIALAYEIIWYRLYAFVSGGAAPCFAMLLGFYLFGIGYGSLAVRDACRKNLGNDVRRTLGAAAGVVLLGAIATFLLGPALARWVVHFDYHFSYVMVFVAAALLGSAFPLLAHAAIDPAQGSGKHLSLLYLSNIVGSTLGSFLVGFILLDHFSLQETSMILLLLGVATATALAQLSRPRLPKVTFAVGYATCVAVAIGQGPLFTGFYERLLFKTEPGNAIKFSELVENRSGTIAVLPDSKEFGYPTRIVYGGGACDGQINTDVMHDSNALVRPYAVLGMHAKPENVLVIGLSTGAWAQIVANDQDLREVTIVEINPGYLRLIAKYPQVRSLLKNPKVHIVIDDGRRWLVAHPDRHFDLVLMNTTFNWRAHVSNLLSVEFLRLLRAHMSPGGIAYYNTTNSSEALITGTKVFPYALRYQSCLAVSDAPLTLAKTRWRDVLTNYRIDGTLIFDLSNAEHRSRLDGILKTADEIDAPAGSLESRASLQERLGTARIITDDNMGTEWQVPTAH